MIVSDDTTKIRSSKMYSALCYLKYAVLIVVSVAAVSYYLLYNDSTKQESHENEIRPVRYVVAEYKKTDQPSSLTGEIVAQDYVTLSFRVNGKMIERSVSLGDKVVSGQVVARLDPQDIQNNLIFAQSNLALVQSQLNQEIRNEKRQKSLFSKGIITQSIYDDALQRLQSALARLDSAKAELDQVENTLEYTELRTDISGVVTSVHTDSGELVQIGQPVIEVATDEGLDAVFYLPERMLHNKPQEMNVEISLSYDPKIKITGVIREVSPQADPITRTFLVRVGLVKPYPAIRLGSMVTGSFSKCEILAVELPVMSLNKSNNSPAVWVVDQVNHTVSLRDVEVTGYTRDSVIISKGLQNGDLVVTAGVQSLYPGQQVKLLEAE